MRIDLPACGFKNCRYSFDCNCTSKIEYERCEYRRMKDNSPKCGQCEHFTGAGDWNLCCTQSHPLSDYPLGFLCYEDSVACNMFDKKKV